MKRTDFEYLDTHSELITLAINDNNTFELPSNRWAQRYLLKQLGEEDVYMVTYSVEDLQIDEVYRSGKVIFDSRIDAEAFYFSLPNILVSREQTN